ncbi:MAG: outer membrane lipoprotein-sorting protein [Rubrivivax sp.]|nr:outer membrane lipoprotein-sorting protein [Rubrivivax sp.]
MYSLAPPWKSTFALLTAISALWLGVAAPAHAAPDAQAILAASDAVRNPSRPFAVTVTLIEYRNAKQTESNTLAVVSKADGASGQYRTLIRIVAPQRDANKLMLKNGNDLWFFDPASQASIRLSPQQRLLGQASNGDVVTVNLAKDYQAELQGEEELSDGERVMRRAYKLGLGAVSPDVTYHRVEMWVDTTSSRPIKARFFAESGRLLKTAFYRKFQRQLGRERPTEVVIIDGLDPAWVTVMRYSDYAWRDAPDAWFQRDYLPRFKPE